MTQVTGPSEERRGDAVRAAVEREHSQRGDLLTGPDGQEIDDTPSGPRSSMDPAEGPDDPDYDGE